MKNSGSILLSTLWMCAILSVLGLGLSRMAMLEIVSVKYSLGKLRAHYAAWAGLIYTMNLLNHNSVKDLKEKNAQGSFTDPALGQGQYQIQDEESKLNLNALNINNFQVLAKLIEILGFDSELAETIAASVVDWQDEDNTVTRFPYGAEDSEYEFLSKPYHCKNRPFDSLEELLLVKGVTPEIYLKLRDFVTIYPKETNRLSINIYSASGAVLTALAYSSGGPQNRQAADGLVRKILLFQSSESSKELIFDNRIMETNLLGLDEKEKPVFGAMLSNLTNISRYINVKIKSEDRLTSVVSNIDTIILRDDFSIVAWKRN